ncbi:hypothetical protein ACFWP5_52095, partial [Streptomyces sp. NPDC058469]
DGTPRGGGSSWQSLNRGTGTIEADYLNGEIARLGALGHPDRPGRHVPPLRRQRLPRHPRPARRRGLRRLR